MPNSVPLHPISAALAPENFLFLKDRIYRDSGIVLDDSKTYLIESRLGPIVAEERLRTLNDLCKLLRATHSPELNRRVVEAMTTNETLFFRDPALFETLRTSILPALIQKKNVSRKLRFWSAAASTGQEAYSLAMLLLEMGLEDWDLRITGTDLNQQVLERASAGRYLQIEVNRGLNSVRLARYFEKTGTEWQISNQVRKLVDFRPFDLRGSYASLGQFDIVLCRNVLIYFDLPTKKNILSAIRSTLFPGGYVVLGCAESTVNLDSVLLRQTDGQSVFYQMP